MKKIPFITAVVCAVLLLAGCGALGYHCWRLDSRNQKLAAESSRLQAENSDLNTALESSATEHDAALKEKEEYIEGQKDYISELSQRIETLTQNSDSDSDDGEDSDGNPLYDSDNDPYPELYAAQEEPSSETTEKYVYLTFDDGPSSLTPQVLDLLDEYGAKATFFVVQKNNEEYAEYLSDIVERGHTLALHSYSHDYNEIYRSVDAFLADYEKVFNWVYEETGYTPFLFRFPGGSSNGSSYVTNGIIREMERRGFTFYDWNVSSGDGSNLTTTANIIDNICSNVGNVDNPVVLMHDGAGKNATLAALPTVLKNLADAGYEFRALTQSSEPVQYR